jgi:hypothetical protein
MRYEKYIYLNVALMLGAVFWVSESVLHTLFFDEDFSLMPEHANELWMRVLIVLILLLFGWFAQKRTNREMQLELETKEIYRSMIKANNLILNNFMQKMYLFKLAAEESNDFDRELLTLYNQTIDETKRAIKKLEGLDRPSASQIEELIKPGISGQV